MVNVSVDYMCDNNIILQIVATLATAFIFNYSSGSYAYIFISNSIQYNTMQYLVTRHM